MPSQKVVIDLPVKPTTRSAKVRRAAPAAHAKAVSRGHAAKKGGKPARRRRRVNPENLRVLRSLLLPPLGVARMWQRACTWKTGVKIAVTCVVSLLLAALIALPLPAARSAKGGVSLVNRQAEAEVYGPELPVYVVPGYTAEKTESVIVDAVEDNVHYVYAADGAKCYHEYECKFAFASSQKLTVYEAYFLGFKPCNRCNPPVYNGQP